jgi:hypothetical protein
MALLFFFITCATYAQSDKDRLFTAIQANDASTVDALLKSNHELLKARRSYMTPVLDSLFIIDKGFMNPATNKVLATVMSYKPELDIYEASGVGDLARVKALLHADRSLAASWSPMGWTPLHYAAFGGNADVVALLMKEGASGQVNARAKTKFKNTPLQTAMLSAQYASAKYLLEHGADPLIRQSKGFTPLQAAAESGRRDIIDLLLEHGAEINSRTDDGRNAWTEAMRFGHEEVAEYLKSKGAADGQITIDLMRSPD